MFVNLNLMKLGRGNLSKNKSQNTTNENVYQELGDVERFAILVGGQFNSFIAELSSIENTYLTEIEREGFKSLWSEACIDIAGLGNNIWQLPKGTFTIFDARGIKIKFHKRDALVEKEYGTEEGRSDFFFLSNNGNFVIHQDDRNKQAFLVGVSENLDPRLLNALRYAEAKALNIKYRHSEDVSLRPIHR